MSAADVSASTVLAAVAGLRGEPGEAGNLLAVKVPEFGHFAKHVDGDECADAGDRDEDVEACDQFGIVMQAGFQG